VNLTRLFSGTDLARALAAVGSRPVPFEDIERGPVLVYRAEKMVQHAKDADVGLPSPAQRSREVGAELQAPMPAACVANQEAGFGQPDGMADDLGRSYGRRRNTRQMCQLKSMSSCGIKTSLPWGCLRSLHRGGRRCANLGCGLLLG
jgi:hypothetical protein